MHFAELDRNFFKSMFNKEDPEFETDGLFHRNLATRQNATITFLQGAYFYGGFTVFGGGGVIYSYDTKMSIYLNGSVNATFNRAYTGSGGVLNVYYLQTLYISNCSFL